ncbi:MAG: glycosyltransferase family 2 protein [bacterium]
MTGPSVAIIIPNWNGAKFILDCLNSLSKIDYGNCEVVVVDNCSVDDSIELIKNNYPSVKIIQNKENLGFAGGCNKGIKYALENNFDYVLLLNNDTVVDLTFLSAMVVVAQEEPKVGVVGGKIYYYGEERLIWFAGGRYVPWRVSFQHMSWRKKEEKELTGVVECDFITGCLMLIDIKLFKETELFYEPYFLCVEDADFCYRTKKNGWKIKTALDAKIWHKVSASRDGEFSFSNTYYGVRNRLYFAFCVSKNYFGGLFLLFIVLPLRAAEWTMEGKFNILKGLILGITDFLKGKMGERKK